MQMLHDSATVLANSIVLVYALFRQTGAYIYL